MITRFIEYLIVLYITAEVFYTSKITEGFELIGYGFIVCGAVILYCIWLIENRQIKEQKE